jgi:hypothetical protein
VLRKSQARAAYAQNSSLGLFHLFLTKSWFSAMKQWMMIDLAIKRVENVKDYNKQCKHVGNLQDMEYPFEREM